MEWKMNIIDVHECKWWLTYVCMWGGGVPEYKTRMAIEGDIRRDEKWGLVSMGWRSFLPHSI